MLKGERLTLRALTQDDLPTLTRWSNDLNYELLTGGDPPRPTTPETWERRFERDISGQAPARLEFAIEADGRLIGTCGLFDFDPFARSYGLGIGIGEPDCWGRGYGREAVGLLLGYAFRVRNARRVWLTVNGENQRAQRCYRACGFVEEGRLREHTWNDGRYTDSVYMGVLRDEWQARTSPG